MDFPQAMAYLRGLTRFGIKPGLERTERLSRSIGSPDQCMDFVHVAGTNGKGSVSVLLESVLSEQGYKTGLFTSPHLTRYTERIKASGSEIPQDELADIISMLKPIVDTMHEDTPTEFEVCTVACLEWFRRQEVDIAVMEVGLGGRYDSTNIITPKVSAITKIAMDHCDRLGDTLAKIAWDKAGIIKPGIPVAIGRQDPEALGVLRSVVEDMHAPSIFLGEDMDYAVTGLGLGGISLKVAGKELRSGLIGAYQGDNCAIAYAALSLLSDYPCSEDALRRGFLKARNPGRFEIVSDEPLIILDGAHNPDGMQAFISSLSDIIPDRPKVFVVGMSKDKPARPMMESICQEAALIIATRAQASRSGAADPGELAEMAVGIGCKAVAVPDALEAVAHAVKAARGIARDAAVIICGSLYLIGEVRPIWAKGSGNGHGG